jgi:hypothetical protein
VTAWDPSYFVNETVFYRALFVAVVVTVLVLIVTD